MKLAVVGATGMVGHVMLKVLEEHEFLMDELLLVASSRSVGKSLSFKGEQIEVIGLETALAAKPDLALFSAGGATSMEWAPKFAAEGVKVIDNSSAWRMDPTIKLVVPEINASVLTPEDMIIANPNCSTIQMVMALAPLHEKYGLQRLVISTYQSITGTGVKAVEQLENETAGIKGPKAYPHTIHKNALPHCDIFLENAYTKEEMKLVHETRKILGAPDMAITATAIRIPVVGGHSESVNVSLEKSFDLEEVRRLLDATPGVVVLDDPENNLYPMPLQAADQDEVFVGRIRRDESIENGLNLWVVADNLRKGAATNTIQIAEFLVNNQLL